MPLQKCIKRRGMQPTDKRILGIDLGGRTTAKTAICLLYQAHAEVMTTTAVAEICRGSDERFLELILSFKPDIVAIDAPLSLPDVRTPDYLYRPADKAASALSPWTIGEIAARAQYMAHTLQQIDSKLLLLEVYPKNVLQFCGLPHRGYKKNLAMLRQIVTTVLQRYSILIPTFELTGDNVDSLLCCISGWHYAAGRYKSLHSDNTPAYWPPFVQPI